MEKSGQCDGQHFGNEHGQDAARCHMSTLPTLTEAVSITDIRDLANGCYCHPTNLCGTDRTQESLLASESHLVGV